MCLSWLSQSGLQGHAQVGSHASALHIAGRPLPVWLPCYFLQEARSKLPAQCTCSPFHLMRPMGPSAGIFPT